MACAGIAPRRRGHANVHGLGGDIHRRLPLLEQELLLHYILRIPELETPDLRPTSIEDLQAVANTAARKAVTNAGETPASSSGAKISISFTIIPTAHVHRRVPVPVPC